MAEKVCRECGASSSDTSIGRGGRCFECGMARMMLGFRLNGVAARMTNAELEEVLSGLEAKHGSGGAPRRLPPRLKEPKGEDDGDD